MSKIWKNETVGCVRLIIQQGNRVFIYLKNKAVIFAAGNDVNQILRADCSIRRVTSTTVTGDLDINYVIFWLLPDIQAREIDVRFASDSRRQWSDVQFAAAEGRFCTGSGHAVVGRRRLLMTDTVDKVWFGRFSDVGF